MCNFFGRISKAEYDELQRLLREEEEAIEKALRESERLSQLLISTNDARVSVHDLREFLKQSEALEAVQEEEEENPQGQPPITGPKVTEMLADRPPDQFVSVKQFISPQELQKRQAYLRAQKEKLHNKRETLNEQASSPSVRVAW